MKKTPYQPYLKSPDLTWPHLTHSQTERILNRVIEALGLTEMGQEVTNDVEMIICRCQQLAKLEGEKIVDKVRRA